MSRQERIVWVVMHVEIMGHPDAPRVDTLLFHVSSSLEKAEVYMRDNHVASYSWWQVYPYELDSMEFNDGSVFHYYNHRGTRLKGAPEKRAISTFRKYVANHPEWWGPEGPQPLNRS